MLDDLTVWGISLPNDWLGGLKGQDLLGQTVGSKGWDGFLMAYIRDDGGLAC